MPSPNPASILDSVKKALGVDVSDTSFDLDITMYINAVFGPLQQIGVGPREGFLITDNTTLWSDYTPYKNIVGMVQAYVYLKVQTLFDPPQIGFVIQAKEKVASELESRLLMAVEDLDPPFQPPVNRHRLALDPNALIGDVTFTDLEDRWGNIIYSSTDTDSRIITRTPYWWDITGHDDFPAEAEPGDWGIDTATTQYYVLDFKNPNAYWWDLTGGANFPADALIGDLGIDKSTGQLWRYY